ncbi:unnamed protein product [Cladocopium goreaui]|uniref:CCHC-type domain-containing protein n=1 Tax=Cladocopium goreaui TaxID=2562237 RepID=A0A9P1BVX6_9DINO|nr:unnamed protein product [Cladocopium goreaui]
MSSSALAGNEVLTWSGDPAEFQTFSVACRWYVKSLKDSERKQVFLAPGMFLELIRHRHLPGDQLEPKREVLQPQHHLLRLILSRRRHRQAAPAVLSDFFGDELRGYRLLKAARLSAQERQNILTQTGNSTNFLAVRRALRTSLKRMMVAIRVGRSHGFGGTLRGQQDWHEAYWQDWSPWTYDDWGDSQFDESWHDASPKDELPVDDQADDPAETQYKEAYALAVRRVRQARGYFAPESMTGKGIPLSRSPSGSPKGKSGMGKSLGAKGKSFGPCFVCGLNGHSWRQCPDRFAKGGKGGSLFPKGKGKSKKGFKSLQFHDISPCFDPGIYTSDVEPGTRVIIDTGASEKAVGMYSLGMLIEKGKISYDVNLEDRPVFKFGNRHKAQAVSRVDLLNTSIGTVSFYVLGDEANQTPPLVGGKTLRQLGAMLAYEDNLLIYKRQEPPLKPTFSCCQEFQMRSNGKTDLATWLKGFNFCVIKFVMGTPVQPCAEDDPRVRRFPCFSHHKRKERQNQFAIWSTCLACGLRITYRPKKDSHGEDRHMGPHPHLIKMAMDQIEASMPKDQVSEKVVNGMLMELKGLQLQHGVSNTMAVNMTYAQYMKRMGFKEMDAQSSEWEYAEMSVHASESETEEEEDKKKRGPSSLCRSMASLHEKMRFGGRDGHTSQDTSLLNSHGIPNGRDAGAAFPMAEMLAPLLKAATRIQRKVKFQNQALEVDNAKEFNLTLHERWLEMQPQATDFIEVACAPTSSLTASMESLGHSAYRINYRNGFDLDKKDGTTKLAQYVQALTNLTQRDEVEQANFQKRQGRDLKKAEGVVDAMEPILESHGDLSWEWPTGATKGWNSKAIRKLESPNCHVQLQWQACMRLLAFLRLSAWMFLSNDEYQNAKYKFLLMRDRASALVMVEFLKKHGAPEETAWEPTSEDIIKSFSRWLMVNPAPKWIITDAARHFTSQRILDYAGQSGTGVLTAPAEAHQMMGSEEGASAPLDNIPLGINPKKAFGGMLGLKERMRVAFQAEGAKAKLSKLKKTIPQPTVTYKPGQLLMLWRQRSKPGKTGGTWVGPVRMLLQEGHTVWLATGSTLIRARLVQVRPCTRQEELNSILEGTAILKLPVMLDSLLRKFTGRYYSDVTGAVPSMETLRDDVRGTEVQLEPGQQAGRPDSWKITNFEGKKWLVRIDSLPRISLVIPSKTQTTPVDEEMLTGIRKTKLKGLHPQAELVEINDDYKESDDPTRPDTSATPAEQPQGDEDANQQGVMIPDVPNISPLTTALRDKGGHQGPHEDVAGGRFVQTSDGKSIKVGEEGSSVRSRSSSSSSDELVPDDAIHINKVVKSNAVLDTNQVFQNAQAIEPNQVSKNALATKSSAVLESKDVFYALEIPIKPSDTTFLTKNPEKSSIWLSRKTMEKGKELRWSHMDMSQKQSFDMAQARELTNVLSAKALRSLTENFDPVSAMPMGWVLTTKADGSITARLVVLGFQAANVAEVDTAAPTMARVSRNWKME